MTLETSPGSNARRGAVLLHRLAKWDLASVTIALALICVVLLAFVPAFHSAYNLNALAFTVSITGVVALAQLCVLSVGQFNLALTAIGAATGIFSGYMMQELGVPFPVAVLIGLLFGCAAGALQGGLIVVTGINPFVVSLAIAAIYFGAMLGLTKGTSYNRLPQEFVGLGRARLGGIPILPALSLLIGATVALLFHRSVTGRRLLATGASSRTALMSGIRTGRMVLIAHVLSGGLAAVAALMLVTRLGSAQPSLGSEWLLPSFAAPVLGGTLLTGGKVGIIGTFLGALLLAVIANGLVLFGVSAYWYQSLLGVVLLTALAIDKGRLSYVAAHRL